MIPKFYPNLSDDNHCLQASVMMVLNSLKGETSWGEVNALTQFENGLYSWNTTAAAELAKRVPGVKFIASTIEYEKFAELGEPYLQEVLDPAWFADQKVHASLAFQKEQRSAKELIQRSIYERRTLTKDDVTDFLNRGYWLIALVNSRQMRNLPGISGHFVLVYGHDNENYIMHNPGLPAQPEWSVSKDLFMRAFQGETILIPAKETSVGPND